MSGAESTPPRHVPTLTEVIDWPDAGRLPLTEASPLAVGAAMDRATEAPGLVSSPASAAPFNAPAEPLIAPLTAVTPASALPSEAQIVDRVLGQVQRQIDLMLEYRLREALMPVLARATEALIRDARSELASTLRDVVTRAVAQEMARHRQR